MKRVVFKFKNEASPISRMQKKSIMTVVMFGFAIIMCSGINPLMGMGKMDKVFYVSPVGNDSWNGLLPESDGKEGPFLTIERARDAVREWKAMEGGSAVTVYLRGGEYRLEETFILEPEDTGLKESPIRYTAYGEETPVIVGSRKITGWKPYRDGIYMAEAPYIKGGRLKFRQLFCDGDRMICARWPNYDPGNPLYGGWSTAEDGYQGSAGYDYTYRLVNNKHTRTFKYYEGSFSGVWEKPWNGEVNYYAGWGGFKSIVPIASVNADDRIITLTSDGYQFDYSPWHYNHSFRQGNRFYVENILEELDQPGEWCADYDDGVIYFKPPEGVSITEAVVAIPVLSTLFDVRGVSHVEISELTFSQSLGGDNLFRFGVDGGGCMVYNPSDKYVGEGILMKDTKWCRVEGNHFHNLGGNGLYLLNYNTDNTIRGNEFSYCGASGVCFGCTKVQYSMRNDVCDNHIHHCGIINKNCAGILMSYSNGNLLHHNLIEYMPDHAINLNDSPDGRNIVEYNEIHHVCQEDEDTGAINCWMELGNRDAQRCGHIIRYNLITDIYGIEGITTITGVHKSVANGIYLDGLTSNCVVYGNIIARCTYAGILVGAGKNNLIENNIVYDCGLNMMISDWNSNGNYEYWRHMSEFISGNYILRNVFFQDSGKFTYYLMAWTENVVAWADYNVFFNTSGKYDIFHQSTIYGGQNVDPSTLDKSAMFENLDKWMSWGYEKHSVIADPMFAGAEKGDFSLLPDSPAFKLGFKRLDQKEAGIRKNWKEVQ